MKPIISMTLANMRTNGAGTLAAWCENATAIIHQRAGRVFSEVAL
ncbi:MAG: hypothetical protein P4M02_08825 [Clostridia bacterium]|nr:hypothetical protein [Clostridia bacterium]